MTSIPKLSPKRQWVTVAYVQEATGFSKYRCYQMARLGVIPSIKVGRAVRFDPAAIDKWMQQKASA